MNLADFTTRTTLEDGDRLTGHRGNAAGGESAWTGAMLKALIASMVGNGAGLNVVSMPANSAASGAIGQIAIGGGRLAIYVGQSGGPNWIFLDFYQIS